MKEKKTIFTRLRLKKKYAVLLLVLGGISLFALVLGLSYAFFTTSTSGSNVVVYTGNLEVNYTKTGNLVNLSDTYPMTNSQGLSTEGYTFNITNTGTIDAKYLIRLELDSTNTLPMEYVKLSYNKTKQNNNTTDNPYTEPVLVSNLNSSLIFVSDQVIESGKMDSYNLKLWIDYSAPNDVQGKTFKAKITVDAIQNVDKGYALANTIPIITLSKYENGEIDAHLKVNDTFTDPGIEIVKDDKDKLTESNVTKTYEYTSDGENLTTVNSIDTSVAGVYYINYEVTDSDNLVGKATRVVTVNNTTAIPTITLNGESVMEVNQNRTFVDPGVTVENNNKVATISGINSVLGAHSVKYIVISPDGGINSLVRTVNVLPPVYDPGDLIQFDPVANKTCTAGETCYKWRVLTIGDTLDAETITLQMDHNLFSVSKYDDKISTEMMVSMLAETTESWTIAPLNYTYGYEKKSDGSYITVMSCTDGTCVDNSGNTFATNVKARMITGEEVCALTKYAGAPEGSLPYTWTPEATNTEAFWFSASRNYGIGGSSLQYNSYPHGQCNTILSWLIENTYAANGYGGATNNEYGDNNYGYFSLTTYKGNSKAYSWAVDSMGTFQIKTSDGIRPVITIPRSSIE